MARRAIYVATFGDCAAHLQSAGSYRLSTIIERKGWSQQQRQASLNALRGAIDKGRKSGKPRPAAEVLDRLERKYTKAAQER